ncbi:lactonase family protein [bacterium]|nr:lactonase family protein [bacterium]
MSYMKFNSLRQGLALCVLGTLMSMCVLKSDSYKVYVGTYTGKDSEGIYAFGFDKQTGKLTSDVKLVARTENPSFLALHPAKSLLYAVNETGNFNEKPTGAVSAFRLNEKDGSLDLINQVASRGKAPCHLEVDATGGSVLVANYTSGTVSVLPIEENGGLGTTADVVQHLGSSVNSQRQEGPHAHCINLDGHNRFAVAADLGVDKVFVYPFDAERNRFDVFKASSVSLRPGAGPRHFAFHPNNRFGYVINELDNTVTAFKWDSKTGKLEELHSLSTLPEGFEGGNSTAELFIHPTGQFLYGSNRGHHSIVVYQVDKESGRLNYVENESTQGETPRSFGIDPSGKFLLAANQSSSSIVVFEIDPVTGALNATGTHIDVPTPVSVIFR